MKNEKKLFESDFFLYVLKNYKLNFVSFCISFILIIIYVFIFMEKYYTATVTILPPSANMSSTFNTKISALKSLAGINLDFSTGVTPEFVRGIMQSRQMFNKIASEEISFKEKERIIKQKLIDFLDINYKNENELLQKAYKEYKRSILLVDIDPDNNFIYVSVTLRNPDFAAQIANRLVDETKYFLKDYLEKSMFQQALFLGKRIQTIRDSITIAEDLYKNFLEKVVNISKPDAIIKKIELEKKVELYYQIFIELKKQEELMKLQNIDQMSDLKILDSAIPPYRKSKPKRIFVVIILSGLVAVAILMLNASVYYYTKTKKLFLSNFNEN